MSASTPGCSSALRISTRRSRFYMSRFLGGSRDALVARLYCCCHRRSALSAALVADLLEGYARDCPVLHISPSRCRRLAASDVYTQRVKGTNRYQCETENENCRERWLTQVILTNQLTPRYSGERRALEFAELSQALPVTLARRKRLSTDSVPREKVSGLELPLGQKWQIWALDEERRRTGSTTCMSLVPVSSVDPFSFDFSNA